MPTTLVLAFPWGRYGATQWGRRAGGGAAELPPSPWRLLRDLHAVWRTRALELPGTVMLSLLARLAEPPVFHLPHPAASRDLTFDAFAGHDPELAVCWPFTLPDVERAALERIAGSVPYLGRADNLCHGRLQDGWRPRSHDTWSPVDTASALLPGAPATSVLAPTLPLDVDALLARPAAARRGGLLLPGGTRLVGYQRVPAPVTPVTPVTAVRFTVQQSPFPPETDSLIYTDLLRRAALHRLGRPPQRRPLTQLGGKAADADGGGHRVDQHQHAHYLPILRDRRLTGLAVWAPGGLPDDELSAVAGVRQLRSTANGSWLLAIGVAGIGGLPQIMPGLPGPSRTWESATPFTPTRYPKSKDWPSFLTTEAGRELAYRGFPEPCSVDIIDREWAAWRRYRPSARMRQDPHQGAATRPSAFLRLTFATPVTGPVAIGHLSHFGLGHFLPQ